jgi:hypothetical protein
MDAPGQPRSTLMAVHFPRIGDVLCTRTVQMMRRHMRH